MKVIEFRDVYRKFGNKEALAGIDITIKTGEIVTLIGPSGCGKTTLLKLINGMENKTSGEIKVLGQSIDEWDLISLRRKIGYVIQNTGLFPHMRIWENIGYVMGLEGMKKPVIMERARELIQLVNLDSSFLEKYPRQLSGGEKQRIGVARALAIDPKIILMDEPFGAVDEINRKVLQDELLFIHQKLGKTIVFVTHDIEEAMKLGTRIVLMNRGRIVNMGTKKEMLFSEDRFVNEFFNTKDFLSYINITSISEVMEKSDIMGMASIHQDESIAMGLKLLLKNDHETLTVLDHNHQPVGLFSLHQLRSL